MKKVLWVSRHRMSEVQFTDLERVMGGPVELIPWQDTVKEAAQLAPALAEADAAAVVLPVELLAQFLPLAGEKPVLMAVSGRKPTGRLVPTPTGRLEPEFAFVHQGWRQILRLELDTKPL